MAVRQGQNGNASDINNVGFFLAGEAIAAGDAVALAYDDYKIYKASAAALDKRINFIGFAMAAAVVGAGVDVNVLTSVSEKTSLTANSTYYLSDTPGAISTSVGSIERVVGRAVSTSRIIRKRGFVSPSLLISFPSVCPCDAFAYVSGGSTSTVNVTTEGINVNQGTGFAFTPVRMGATLTGASVSGRFHFVIFDGGGFY